MKPLMTLFLLITACFVPVAAEAAIARGVYEGTNTNAWIWKNCRLEVYGESDSAVRLVLARDSSRVYNFWFSGTGADGLAVMADGVYGASALFNFLMKDSSNSYIYDSAEKLATTSSAGSGDLVIRTDSLGRPAEYDFYQFSLNSTGKKVAVNKITCRGLNTR